jgi:hypothetical protein
MRHVLLASRRQWLVMAQNSPRQHSPLGILGGSGGRQHHIHQDNHDSDDSAGGDGDGS